MTEYDGDREWMTVKERENDRNREEEREPERLTELQRKQREEDRMIERERAGSLGCARFIV